MRRIEPSFDEPRRTGDGLALTEEDRVLPKAAKRRQSAKPGKASKPAGRGTRRASSRRSGKTRRRGVFARLVRGMIYWSLVLALWAGIGGAGLVAYYGARMPAATTWAVPDRPPNVKIVAVDGQLLANRGMTGGQAVGLHEMSPQIAQAVVAIEDRRFYSHFGLDPVGLARAMGENIVNRRLVQGGSTITQQLAKNLFLKPDRTLRRKIQEVVLALWLEYNYSKDEILEMYLNRAYLGAGATGVEAAARVYFDKSAREVTLAESAVIAGLLQAPSRYAPTRNPDVAQARAQLVLAAMLDVGFISDEQAKAALTAPAEVRPPRVGASVGYAADWVAELVPSLIGELRRDVVVDTTIDPALQSAAERALVQTIDSEGAERRVSEGAVVVMQPDGAVRALVGGRDYMRSQFNRAVKARRQPGSAFKPFVYLAAMEAGLSPTTLRTDAPTQFGNWSPSNYSGEFRGPTPLADALAQSINTVAVRLAAEVGPERVIEAAHRTGIGSDLVNNLTIALGTSEVTPLELTAAYAPFANGGHGANPYVVRRIRTTEGDILYERPHMSPMPVLSEEVVGAMNHMMRRTVESGTGRGAAFGGWPAAGKTGTSQEFRDAWFIGYTAHMVAGIWLGNDDNRATGRVTGGSLPARIWRQVMETAHEGVMVADLPGHYVPREDHIVVDHTLPWLQDGRQPVHHYASEDPSRPVPQPAREEGGFFNIDRGFLSRLFGG